VNATNGRDVSERSQSARDAAIVVPATVFSIAGHAHSCGLYVAVEYSVGTHRSGITSASYTRLRAGPQKSTMAWSRVCDRQLAIATRSKITAVLGSTWVRMNDGRRRGARIAVPMRDGDQRVRGMMNVDCANWLPVAISDFGHGPCSNPTSCLSLPQIAYTARRRRPLSLDQCSVR
jgi:hypothetical protein